MCVVRSFLPRLLPTSLFPGFTPSPYKRLVTRSQMRLLPDTNHAARAAS
jgi:hypothetical protein